MNWLKQIIAPVTDYMGARVELKRAKVEAEAKAYQTAAESEAAWEMVAAQNNGWLDEYWTAVLSVPLIGSFIPFARPWIADGFQTLAGLPEWYLWGLGASMGYAFARKHVPTFLGGTLGRIARK